MSLFGTILEKLGLKKKEEEQAAANARTAGRPAPPAPQAAQTPAARPAASTATPAPHPATPTPQGVRPPTPVKAAQPAAAQPVAPPAPKAISEVDVVKQLDELSKGKDLNWKNSIVDLLKLLDIDSSYNSRVELAKELGCPPDQMSDSARMNVWLHKTVLKKIAENGGNIPADLLD